MNNRNAAFGEKISFQPPQNIYEFGLGTESKLPALPLPLKQNNMTGFWSPLREKYFIPVYLFHQFPSTASIRLRLFHFVFFCLEKGQFCKTQNLAK
jgi:hypothetical protein